MSSEDIDNEDVNDIVSQIRSQSRSMREDNEKLSKITLDPENVEQFVLDNAANLVQESVQIISKISETVSATMDAELIEAASELFKAASSGIAILSNLNTNKEKMKTQKEICQMNIDARKTEDPFEGIGQTPKGIYCSRKEMLEMLETTSKRNDKVIDVD